MILLTFVYLTKDVFLSYSGDQLFPFILLFYGKFFDCFFVFICLS